MSDRLLRTAGALRLAENQLREQFLLRNGDTYLPIDYGAMPWRTQLAAGTGYAGHGMIDRG